MLVKYRFKFSFSFNLTIILMLLFGAGCREDSLTKLDSWQNKLAITCGVDSVPLNSQYQFFRFTDPNNSLIPMRNIKFGNRDSEEKEGLVVTSKCLGLLKSSKKDHFVYSYLKDQKVGLIITKETWKEASKVIDLNLKPFNASLEHFKSCGRENPKYKNRTIAIKAGFHKSYSKDKNFKSYQVSVLDGNKLDPSFSLNQFDCFYISVEDQKKVVEISPNSDSENTILRRSFLIWNEKLYEDLERTQISICKKGFYGLDGNCISNFRFYCEQEKYLERAFLGPVKLLKTKNKENSCEKLEAKILKTGKAGSNSFTFKEPDGLNFDLLFFMDSLLEFYFRMGNVANINFIKNSTSLIWFYCELCSIIDISPLKRHRKIKKIFLSLSDIKDISPLKNLFDLRRLDIYSNDIEDISALRNLNLLTRLDIFDNRVTDISPLENLSNLTHLYMDKNPIEDFSVLQKLINLRDLNVENTTFNDLSLLDNHPNLTRIILEETKVRNLIPLKNLPQLKEIDLSKNELVDLTPLAQLVNLNTLNLKNNEIVDISPLKNIQGIKVFAMEGNPLGTSVSKTEGNCPTDSRSAVIAEWCKK